VPERPAVDEDLHNKKPLLKESKGDYEANDDKPFVAGITGMGLDPATATAAEMRKVTQMTLQIVTEFKHLHVLFLDEIELTGRNEQGN
jgi:hypothetical protein